MFRKLMWITIGLVLSTPVLAHDSAEPAALPDLVVQISEPMQRAVVVKNEGQAVSSETRLLIGCKPRTLPSAPPNKDCALGATYSNFDDTEVNTVAGLDVPGLAPGESVTLQVPYWRSLALNEDQPYHFKVSVDPENLVAESDDENNVARSYLATPPVDIR